MRIRAAILIYALATAPLPVFAADPNQVFSTILGEIGRQIERQQREKQLKHLQPLWDACAKGDVAACDRAARFPALNAHGRAEIERMRQAAKRHLAFVRNFQTCQRMDRGACEAALAYPLLGDTDRIRLLDWKRNADQHHDALAEFRRNQHSCYAGSIIACSAAIDARRLDPGATPDLERQLAALRMAEQERQAAERQRQALLARAQHAEQQRQAAERQRQAEIREYAKLRSDCAGGQRTACSSAATHAQVRGSDMAFIKQRERELAPFTERLSRHFTEATFAVWGSSNPSVSALLVVLALCAAGFGAVYVVRKRTPIPPTEREPPRLASNLPAEQPVKPTTAVNFPLTGHMPTDVRRALLSANS